MKNYKEVALNNIRQRGVEARRKFEDKILGLYQNEEFKQLVSQHSKVMIENARRIAYDEIPDFEKEELLKLQIDKFYKVAGLEKPKHFCTKCQDTGFDGCGVCDCVRAEISILMMKDNGFEQLQSFEKSIETVFGENRKFYQKMLEWCDNKDRSKSLVYICGAVGVGKTHLQKCIGQRFIEQGKVVKLVSAVKFSSDTRKLMDEIIFDYSRVQVLMIDDLGVEVTSDSTRQALQVILSERKERGLLTIITSNLLPAEILERYGERVLSRITDKSISICFEMKGQDRRRNPILIKEALEVEICKIANS